MSGSVVKGGELEVKVATKTVFHNVIDFVDTTLEDSTL